MLRSKIDTQHLAMIHTVPMIYTEKVSYKNYLLFATSFKFPCQDTKAALSIMLTITINIVILSPVSLV